MTGQPAIGRPPAVVEKPSERKLEKAMERIFRVKTVIRSARLVQFVRIHRIKIGSVHWVLDTRQIRRRLLPEPLFKVNRIEKGVTFHLFRVLSDSLISSNA